MSVALQQERAIASTPEEVTVWKNPEGLFDKMAILTSERIVFADPNEAADVEPAIDAFQRDGTLPPRAEVIDFDSITKVGFNEKSTQINVHYANGKRKTTIRNFDFDDHTARNSFADSLSERLGDRFTAKRKQLNGLTASFKPLFFGAAIALATWGLRSAAEELVAGREANFSGRNSGIKRLIAWMLELIGPTGVVIIGSLMLVVCALVLFKRISDPPILRSLVRRA